MSECKESGVVAGPKFIGAQHGAGIELPVPPSLTTFAQSSHTCPLSSPKDDFIKTTYDISLDSQISLLPRGFSLLVGSEKTSGNKKGGNREGWSKCKGGGKERA